MQYTYIVLTQHLVLAFVQKHLVPPTHKTRAIFILFILKSLLPLFPLKNGNVFCYHILFSFLNNKSGQYLRFNFRILTEKD